MKATELAKYFSVSVRTVQRWRKKGCPEVSKNNYKLEDVALWRNSKLEDQDKNGLCPRCNLNIRRIIKTGKHAGKYSGYCSECEKQYYREHNPNVIPRRKDGICPKCNENQRHIIKSGKSKGRVLAYCNKCHYRMNPYHPRDRKLLNKVCAICGKEFDTYINRQIYCSNKCRWRASSLSERGKKYNAQYRKKYDWRRSYNHNRAKCLEVSRKAREELKDSYIKKVICTRTKLQYGDIPKSLIEAYREHIKLKRIIKEIRK